MILKKRAKAVSGIATNIWRCFGRASILESGARFPRMTIIGHADIPGTIPRLGIQSHRSRRWGQARKSISQISRSF
jgi:hypothetical protein